MGKWCYRTLTEHSSLYKYIGKDLACRLFEIAQNLLQLKSCEYNLFYCILQCTFVFIFIFCSILKTICFIPGICLHCLINKMYIHIHTHVFNSYETSFYCIIYKLPQDTKLTNNIMSIVNVPKYIPVICCDYNFFFVFLWR